MTDLFGNPDPAEKRKPAPVKDWATLWDSHLKERKLPTLLRQEILILSRTWRMLWEHRGMSDLTVRGVIATWFLRGSDGERMGFSPPGFISSVRKLLLKMDAMTAQKAREDEARAQAARKREEEPAPLAAADQRRRLAELRESLRKPS